MPETSIVNYQKVESSFRLDAEYYRPMFINIEGILNSVPSMRMGHHILDIKTGSYSGSMNSYFEKRGGIPFIQASSLEAPFLTTKEIPYLSTSIMEHERRLSIVTSEYLLISKRGNVGSVCILPFEIDHAIISRDIIGVKIDENELNKYFLLVFLLTKYGKTQLLRGASSQTRSPYSLEVIKNMLIPRTDKEFQRHIEQGIKQAYNKKRTSEKKYSQAEDLLYNLLMINKEDLQRPKVAKTYETAFKDVLTSFRFDAEFYHPEFSNHMKILRGCPFEIKPLNEIVKISMENIDPKKELKALQFKYIPITKISETGEISEWDEVYGWQAPRNARRVIRKGDILVPSPAGSFNKIALVPEELDGQLTTTDCFVIRSLENIPEFLFLLFRTPLFKEQLEQHMTRATRPAVSKRALETILLPKVPNETQQEIASLVKEYFQLRKEGRLLIQRAIQEVEEVIEHSSRNSTKRE